LDPVKDATTWSKFTAEFQKELVADAPSQYPSGSSYPLKRIAKIWRFGESALVVLEKYSNEAERKEWDRLFEIYSFNVTKNEKSQIIAKWPFWLWKFRQLARFEEGPAPDITFESATCTECEPAIILGALRFDAKQQEWRLRRWLDGDEGVLLADTDAEMDYGKYESASGVADFQATGHDEVAVWTHVQQFDDQDPQKVASDVTTVMLHRIKDGAPLSIEIKDPRETRRIKKMICDMNPQESACVKRQG
jgi:hypothetical protein